MSDKSYALSVVGTLETFFEYGCNIFATGYQPRSDLWQAFNACTETLYTGADAITLAHGMEECDYRQNLWISRGQIEKHGLSLKDSHNSFGFLVSAPDPELEYMDSKKFTPYHLIYNIENLEGLTPQPPIASLINLDFSLSQIIENSQVPIKFGGEFPAYFYKNDEYILIQTQDTFKSIHDYQCVILHELIHATGHRNRLNRFSWGLSEKDILFAQEELTTGLAMVILSHKLGFKITDPKHESHIKSWLYVLNNEYYLIVKACNDAFVACDYIIDNWL